jgi:hypothetical protein
LKDRIFTAEDFEQEEIEDITCPFCENRGYRVLLGPRILGPNEPRPEDYDQFLECPTCYEVIPLHEIPAKEEIKDAVETIDNPFESGKFQLETVYKRNSPKGKEVLEKKRSKKYKLDPDPEIAELLRIYGDNVKVHK